MGELLDGRVVLIAGAGPGLGRDCALICAEHGAAVVLAARSAETVGVIAEEVDDRGGEAITHVTDITSAGSCKSLVGAAIETLGHIDGLINVAYREPDHRTFEHSDDDFANWRAIFKVNLFGTLQTTKAALGPLKARRSGSIVMINSMAAE